MDNKIYSLEHMEVGMKLTGSRSKLFHWLIFIILILSSIFLLCFCGGRKTSSDEGGKVEQTVTTGKESSSLQEYVEQAFGIADNTLYGTQIVHTTENGPNSISIQETGTFTEDTQGGAVFAKRSIRMEKTMVWYVFIYRIMKATVLH